MIPINVYSQNSYVYNNDTRNCRKTILPCKYDSFVKQQKIAFKGNSIGNFLKKFKFFRPVSVEELKEIVKQKSYIYDRKLVNKLIVHGIKSKDEELIKHAFSVPVHPALESSNRNRYFNKILSTVLSINDEGIANKFLEVLPEYFINVYSENLKKAYEKLFEKHYVKKGKLLHGLVSSLELAPREKQPEIYQKAFDIVNINNDKDMLLSMSHSLPYLKEQEHNYYFLSLLNKAIETNNEPALANIAFETGKSPNKFNLVDRIIGTNKPDAINAYISGLGFYAKDTEKIPAHTFSKLFDYAKKEKNLEIMSNLALNIDNLAPKHRTDFWGQIFDCTEQAIKSNVPSLSLKNAKDMRKVIENLSLVMFSLKFDEKGKALVSKFLETIIDNKFKNTFKSLMQQLKEVYNTEKRNFVIDKIIEITENRGNEAAAKRMQKYKVYFNSPEQRAEDAVNEALDKAMGIEFC